MSFNPLVQASGVAYPVSENTTLSHADGHSDYKPVPAGHMPGPSTPQQVNKKRRPSKDKTSIVIRRTSSTPHMRNLALGIAGELSPTDKRRNKLGYHRTSVACGHCRRRKIRCLVSQDEPTGRCAQCIRLKKECNFYPVENPPPQTRPSNITSSSTTPSPQHSSNSFEQVDQFRSPFGANTVPSRYGSMTDSDMEHQHVLQSTALHIPQPLYSYPHTIETQWPPATTFVSSSSVAESPSWQPSPSTANSNYGSESNVSGGHTPVTMGTNSTMSFGAHPEGLWPPPPNFPPPGRSMSYGNIEGLPQHYSNQGLGIQQGDHPRRPYPVKIDTKPSMAHTTLGSNASAPLSAPILPNHQYNYPSPWQSYSNGPAPRHDMPMPGRTMSGQWYGESGQLDQVQEECGSPGGFHRLPEYYSGP